MLRLGGDLLTGDYMLRRYKDSNKVPAHTYAFLSDTSRTQTNDAEVSGVPRQNYYPMVILKNIQELPPKNQLTITHLGGPRRLNENLIPGVPHPLCHPK